MKTHIKFINDISFKHFLKLTFLLALALVFNTEVVAQEKGKKLYKAKEINKMKVTLVVNKNTSDATLATEKLTFKNEFDVILDFENVVRNGKGEIVAITIKADAPKSNAHYAISGKEPIKPIKIEFDANNQLISVSNTNEPKPEVYSYTLRDGKQVKVKGIKKPKGTYVVINSDNEEAEWVSNEDEVIEVVEEVLTVDEGTKGVTKMNKKIVKVEEKDGKKRIIEVTSTPKFNVKEELVFIGDRGKNPLIIVDGEITTKQTMDNLNPKSVKTIEILKGEKAIKKYGAKAQDGVIIITTH